MGAAVLFTLIFLPLFASVALVMVLVKGRMALAAEPVYTETEAEVYASSSAALAFE